MKSEGTIGDGIVQGIMRSEGTIGGGIIKVL